MLKKFGLEYAKPVDTPAYSNYSLVNAEENSELRSQPENQSTVVRQAAQLTSALLSSHFSFHLNIHRLCCYILSPVNDPIVLGSHTFKLLLFVNVIVL